MQSAKEVQYFLFSQQLADGLRITAGILLPAFILYQFGQLTIGLAISLGAMCVTMTDAPGPLLHRRNGMLIAAVIAFAVSFVTAYAKANIYVLGVEIAVLTFVLSLLSVYGLRATSVGNAGILIMILTMGQPLRSTPLVHSLYVLAGSFWYIGLALLFYYIRPYRPAQRVLGDCVRAVADYLSIKALFYHTDTNLQDDYKKLVAQQAVVHEKQEAVREFFFKTARIVTESTEKGVRLVSTFIMTVDLFEDITATYYNYSTLRNRFQERPFLKKISGIISQLAVELDSIGIAIQSNRRYTTTFSIEPAVTELRNAIETLKEAAPTENTLILKKIVVNIRRIAQRIEHLSAYFNPGATFSKTHADHTRFIGHQSLDPRILWNNINSRSAVFKHALRVSIACIVGFTISKLLAYGQHSYWVLLTIAFILKPAFSLTKTRNVERVIGTIAGGLLGVGLLVFIKNGAVHFTVMVLLMIGTYTFMRTQYLVMVICVTAYILILFQFLNIPFLSAVQERVFDTVLGCVIAFSASYFLFPDWEAHQIKKHMAEVLEANAAYLENVSRVFTGQPIDKLAYKLARKHVYVDSANLSSAYQRMAAEPKRRQHNLQLVHQFQVRNHLLFSNVAHLAALLHDTKPQPLHSLWESTQQAIQKLHGLSKKLDSGPVLNVAQKLTTITDTPHPENEPELVRKNVEAIVKLCDAICQTTEAIAAA